MHVARDSYEEVAVLVRVHHLVVVHNRAQHLLGRLRRARRSYVRASSAHPASSLRDDDARARPEQFALGVGDDTRVYTPRGAELNPPPRDGECECVDGERLLVRVADIEFGGEARQQAESAAAARIRKSVHLQNVRQVIVLLDTAACACAVVVGPVCPCAFVV